MDFDYQTGNNLPSIQYDNPSTPIKMNSEDVTYHNSKQLVTSRQTSRTTGYSKNSDGKTIKLPNEDTYHVNNNDARSISNESKGAIPKPLSMGTINSNDSAYTPISTNVNMLMPNINTPGTYSPISTQSNTANRPSTSSTLFDIPITSAMRRSSTISKPLKPGYVYIFNHVDFDDTRCEKRVGTNKDVKSLIGTFKQFKLKTKVIKNATVGKINTTVERIRNKDYSNYRCIVIVILSHGTRHEVIAAKDGYYSINDDILFPMLCNASLKEKPILFFTQACKGPMEIEDCHTDAIPKSIPSEIVKCCNTFEGFVSYRTWRVSYFIQDLCQILKRLGGTQNIKDIIERVALKVKQATNFLIQACKGAMGIKDRDTIPSEILKCWSTREGFVSYRTENGSYFIQALCLTLKRFGNTENIEDIIKRVAVIVKKATNNKQMPTYTSTLTKPFVFGDFGKFSK